MGDAPVAPQAPRQPDDADPPSHPDKAPEHSAKRSDDDFDKTEGAEGEAPQGETENKNKDHSSHQSDFVNQMLADAEKGVREKHMTDHPETEAENKKIIEAEKKAERKKKGEKGDAARKENLMQKVKDKLHHNK